MITNYLTIVTVHTISQTYRARMVEAVQIILHGFFSSREISSLHSLEKQL